MTNLKKVSNYPKDITEYGLAYRLMYHEILQKHDAKFILDTLSYTIERTAFISHLMKKDFPDFIKTTYDISSLKEDIKNASQNKFYATDDFNDFEDLDKYHYNIWDSIRQFINVMDWWGDIEKAKCLFDIAGILSRRISYSNQAREILKKAKKAKSLKKTKRTKPAILKVA